MPTKTFSCPHCGLVLTIRPIETGTRLAYDPDEWKHMCKYPGLDSAALSLLQGRGKGSAN